MANELRDEMYKTLDECELIRYMRSTTTYAALGPNSLEAFATIAAEIAQRHIEAATKRAAEIVRGYRDKAACLDDNGLLERIAGEIGEK